MRVRKGEKKGRGGVEMLKGTYRSGRKRLLLLAADFCGWFELGPGAQNNTGISKKLSRMKDTSGSGVRYI